MTLRRFPHRPIRRILRTAAPLLACALLAALLASGCNPENGGGDLSLGDSPDRSAAAYSNYLHALVRDLAHDLGEGRTLRRLGFLDASPGRERLTRRYGRLFGRLLDLRVDAHDLACEFDGARHRVRFTLVETGTLSGSLLDYEAAFPVEWEFTARDGRLTLARDGIARLPLVSGAARTPDGAPLPGVAVSFAGRVVGGSDDDGLFSLLLPEKAAGPLSFEREGFRPATVPFAATTLEIRLPPIELQPLDGFFPPPVDELRAESGDGAVTLRFRHDRPADRYVVLRRAETGPFERIAELPPHARAHTDRDRLVNGRRYAYRVIPFSGETAAFANPTAAAVPSDEIHRLEAESILSENFKLKVSGRRPYVVRTEGHFEDGYLAFHPAHTAHFSFVPAAPLSAGRYLLRAAVRREERGGRFRLEISQHGDPEPEDVAAFEVDTRAALAHRAVVELGALPVRPVDWRSGPIAASRYALFVRSVPLDGDARARILIDSLEFIRLP